MHNKSQDNTDICTYVKATWNEVVLDLYLLDQLKSNIKDFHGLPRAFKILPFSRRWPKISKLLKAFFRQGWLFFFLPILCCLHALRFAFLILQATPLSDRVNKNYTWIIATSGRVTSVVSRVPKEDRPTKWLVVPWVKAQIPVGDHKVTIEQLLSIWDLPRLIVYSWLGAKAFSQTTNGSQWKLQTYTCFEWFTLWAALQRLSPHEIWASNHYDRWAIMFDQFSSDVSWVLIQHGKLPNPEDTTSLHLKTRLDSVRKIYAFDSSSEQIFKSEVLSDDCAKSVDVQLIGYGLETKPIKLKDFKIASVLVVGNSMCLQTQTKIIETLTHEFPILQILYKEHPLYPIPSKSINDLMTLGVEVIKEKDFFPEVNFVISYASTLADEYAALNFNTYIHGWDLKNSDLEKIRITVKNLTAEKM